MVSGICWQQDLVESNRRKQNLDVVPPTLVNIHNHNGTDGLKNNRMNKFLLSIVVCACAGIIITGCSKNDSTDDNSSIKVINATVENGSDYNSKIDAVKGLLNSTMGYNSETDSISVDGYEVESANFKSGGFTLDLPETVDTKNLQKIHNNEIPNGVSMSDTSVYGNFLSIMAYKSGSLIGEFYYGTEDTTSLLNYALYLYVDRKVTITGTGSKQDDYGTTTNLTYNVSLKKGWNIMYETENISDSGESTTVEVTSVLPDNLKWLFMDFYNSNSYHQKKAIKYSSLRKSFSLFK